MLDIAFTGFKQSGKTTAAQVLVNEYGYERKSFAQPIKDDVVAMINHVIPRYGSARSLITADDLVTHKDVFRPLLQWYGAEFWREYMGDDAHWINVFLENLPINSDERVVCDDLRFLNEAKSLHREGFFIVRIVRDGQNASEDAHASEQELIQIEPDMVIYNDDSAESYTEAIRTLAMTLQRVYPGDGTINVPGGTGWVAEHQRSGSVWGIRLALSNQPTDPGKFILTQHYPMLFTRYEQLLAQELDREWFKLYDRYEPVYMGESFLPEEDA